MSVLHILSSPYNPVHIKNRTDAFAIAVIKFINNMTALGWECIHYGIADAQVNCEMVQCLPVIPSTNADAVQQYNTAAGKEIAKRKKPGDIILCFYGVENQLATHGNQDLIIIEPSIGYSTSAVFAPYRVFVSYAQQHFYYGQQGMLMTPSWTDAVIYNSFDPLEFEFNSKKDNYCLIFGRVISTKGIDLAIQVTEESETQLVIAGPGSLSDLGYTSIPKHVNFVGVADVKTRKQLMKNAKAILGPTQYVEPFGNMIVEGYFSGTPAITTDWGGFTETVINGVTGFRCRSGQEFVQAIKNIDSIDSQVCFNWANDNFNEQVIHKKYDQYLKKIKALHQ